VGSGRRQYRRGAGDSVRRNLSDRIGRKLPVAIGAIGSGLLSFGYRYAISIHNVPLAFIMSLLMWGVVCRGYNAIFPSFYRELFPI
jgi:hypothetical protein